MYRKRNIIIISFLFILVLGSCEKWLDLKPENDIIREEFWKSKQQVHSAVMGCYASMLEGGLAERLFLWGEIRGDMLIDNVGIKADNRRILTGDITPINGTLDWKHFYKSINICNTVIEYAKEALETDKTFTWEELKAYEAEALTLRSLLYFYLIRSF